MRRHLFTFVLLATALTAAPAQAQTLVSNFTKATEEVENKLVALANALSAEQYNWRPGAGVKSVREVLLHVAADNYFIPAQAGHGPASDVKISDYASTVAFEKQNLNKEQTIAALKASFVFLRGALAHVPDEALKEKMKVFGQEMTAHQLLVLTTTHLHEHLGQMIAYTRM